MVTLPTTGDAAFARVKTDGLVIEFGKHKGTPWTRLPVSYLKWMINEKHAQAHIAQAELDRRGTRTPELDISGHAIDRASLKCLQIWHMTRQVDEGLHSWLARVAKTAIDSAEAGDTLPDEEGRITYAGITFVFERDSEWPVLKTIYPEKGKGDLKGINELIKARKPGWQRARKAYTGSMGGR